MSLEKNLKIQEKRASERSEIYKDEPESVAASQSPPKKLTQHEFEELVQRDDVTEAEIAPYLIHDQAGSGAFDPVFQLNPDLVESSGLESIQALSFVNGLVARIRQGRYRAKVTQNDNLIKIVSEGDSWFQFPFLLRDIIDHIMIQDEFAVFSLGAAGDHISNMVKKREYLDAIAREEPEFFLISGGGNDLVGGGRLSSVLHKFDPALEPEAYLNEEFTLFEKEIQRGYQHMLRSVTSRFPNLKILCHGYDYAIPEKGPWLGSPMERNKIIDPQLQRDIIRIVMDRVSNVINQTVSGFPNATFIDLRNIVPENGWYDELHPLSSNFGDLAEVIIDRIHTLRSSSVAR